MTYPSRLRLRAGAIAVAIGAATILLLLALPASATAAPPGCSSRTNTTYKTLLECVTLDGVRAHQAAFQEIADANDDPFYPGTRAAGTEGYAESVEYVAGLLEDAGYEVTLDPFQFTSCFRRCCSNSRRSTRPTRPARSQTAAPAT